MPPGVEKASTASSDREHAAASGVAFGIGHQCRPVVSARQGRAIDACECEPSVFDLVRIGKNDGLIKRGRRMLEQLVVSYAGPVDGNVRRFWREDLRRSRPRTRRR